LKNKLNLGIKKIVLVLIRKVEPPRHINSKDFFAVFKINEL